MNDRINEFLKYLKIEKNYSSNTIKNYEIDIDEGLYEYVILKLTLQPLVENALYHGIKNKRGGGTIRITGRKDGQKMIFQVIDNGKGMSEEVLNKLKDNLRQEKSDRNIDSFGLGNVNQRIIHYYGEGYGLEITSRENEGTEAIVTLAAKNNQPFV